MEITLPVQSPVSCRRGFHDRTHLKIKPFLGFFLHGSSSWCKDYQGIRVSSRIVAASADYSRRRPKKGPLTRHYGSAPKGFMPKRPAGLSTQKKEQGDDGEKDEPATTSSDYTELDKKLAAIQIDSSDEKDIKSSQVKHIEKTFELDEVDRDKTLVTSTEVATVKRNEIEDKRTIGGIDEDELKNMEILTERVELEHTRTFGGNDEPATTSSDYTELDKKLAAIQIDSSDEKDIKSSQVKHVEKKFELDEVDRDKTLVTSSEVATVKRNEIKDKRTIGGIDEDELKNMEILTERVELEHTRTFGGNDEPATTSSDYTELDKKLAAIQIDSSDEKDIKSSQVKHVEEKFELDEVDRDKTLVTSTEVATVKRNEIEDKRTIAGIDEDELKNMEILTERVELEHTRTFGGNDEEAITESESEDEADESIFAKKGSDVIIETQENEADAESLERDAHARKQAIEALVEESLSRGNTIFVYPQVLKPDQEIQVFLNRSISTLKNEPVILIMGAYNDWKWNSFTTELRKTELNGDWWSCQVYVPKEAYKINFVFFNGGTVYENNDRKDFSLPVEGGMDAFAFEHFLLEEKHRELKKLAAEKAERERQAEEQRRIEAEKVAIETDAAQAKSEIENRRRTLNEIRKKAVKSLDNVWYIKPSEFKGGDLVRLYYNKSSGPLAQATEVWIHGGQNNWEDGITISGRFVPEKENDGDWWYAHVMVPDRAFVLHWVFANGPPGSATLYDNNKLKDFHAIVSKSIPEEMYWVEEEHRIFRNLQKERKLQEEAIRVKAERTARMKAEMKERTIKMFLLFQKHVVYTEPLGIQAGTTVTIYYNPSNTVLNGKSEVWLRCSFNRWTHRNGPLPPQRMSPADNSTHLKATVKVPLDAYMMDFVFSEKENGGIYDNKNGMDYHIPVFGGVAKEPPMHIVHVSVEMAPIAKVGGLGDVVTSLSRAVQDLGHNVDIILPKYDCLNLSNVMDFRFNRSFHWGGTEIKIWFGKVEGLSVYFLEPQNGFFWARCIYGCKNDGQRFSFFCHAALEFLQQSGFHPDILHCHDWSSAPVAWLFKENYMHYGLSKARVVFTIHNLEFGVNNIGKAMTFSDKATTVSHTYSKEVSGNPVIAPHLYKFHGILNGIDPDIWDPYNDKFIPVSYTPENVVEGKRAAKEALQQRLGLKKSDLPLVGIITRLTVQKGIHLIKHAICRTLERNGQVVLLGSAPDPRIQNDFVNLANHLHHSHADRARLCLTYDEPLSHLIYAGADFILVPSIFEPCGLTQLTAMRYGSIPVVRKTGGLYDTVFDVDHDKERAQAQGLEPNGFNFDGADSAGVDYALNRAISAWYDGREWFNSLCKQVMEQDWSWNRPTLDYMELYYAARKLK